MPYIKSALGIAWLHDEPAIPHEEDARNIRHRELEGPRASTCLRLPLTYESIPAAPHEPLQWD